MHAWRAFQLPRLSSQRGGPLQNHVGPVKAACGLENTPLRRRVLAADHTQRADISFSVPPNCLE